MSTSSSRILRFEAFTLDVGRGVLLRGGSELRLRRQTFEVLRYLAERAGHVVSSHELVQVLWTSAPADANASTGQCVKEIRRALGSEGRWIIKTVTGCGYEFKAAVTSDDRPPLKDEGSPKVLSHAASLLKITEPPVSRWRSRNLRLSVVSATVAAIAGIGLWLGPRSEPTPSTLTMMAVPTIAVLPFRIAEADDSGNTANTGSIGELIRSELARASPGLDLLVKSAVEHGKEPSRKSVRYLVRGTTWQQQPAAP